MIPLPLKFQRGASIPPAVISLDIGTYYLLTIIHIGWYYKYVL